MKHCICAFISIFALAGCAQDYLATGLPRLEGQPVAQALDYLGPPSEKIKTGNDTIYTWINNQSGSFNVPQPTPSPVVVQNGGHPTVVFRQPMPSVPNTYDWHCRLDITARKGVVVHTDYEGDSAGCHVFSEKLKPLLAVPEDK
jgi:hypothetical protein